MKTLALTATLVLFGACTSTEKGASEGPQPALSTTRTASSIQPASEALAWGDFNADGLDDLVATEDTAISTV